MLICNLLIQKRLAWFSLHTTHLFIYLISYICMYMWLSYIYIHVCICLSLLFLFIYLFIYLFSGPHLQHMEVPRLVVESELQLPAFATATETWDPSCVYNLHHSSRQNTILNSLSEARDQTHIFMGTSQIHFHCATRELSVYCF